MEATRLAHGMELEAAAALAERGLEEAAAAPDGRQAEGWCRFAHGLTAIFSLPADEAHGKQRFGESLWLFEDVGDREGQAMAMYRLLESADLHWSSPEYEQVLEEIEGLLVGVDAPIASGQMMFERGYRAYAEDDHDSAQSWLRQAMGQFALVGYDRGIAGMKFFLGVVENSRGDAGAARPHLEQALEIYLRLGDHLRAADTYDDLADVALAEGNRAAFEKYMQLAVEAGEHLPAGFDQAHHWSEMSMVYADAGDLSSALEIAQRGLTVLRETAPDERELEASLVSRLGWYNKKAGNAEGARLFYEEFLALEAAAARPGLLASAYKDLGVLARDAGEPEAVAQFEAAAEIFRQQGDDYWLAWVADELGTLAIEAGDHEAALYWSELTVEAATRAGVAGLAGNGWIGIARSHLARWNTTAAVEALQRAMESLLEDGDTIQVAKMCSWLGDLYYEQGDCRAARSAYEESLTAAIEVGDAQWHAQALEDLIKVADRLDDDVRVESLCHQLETLAEQNGSEHDLATVARFRAEVAQRQGDEDTELLHLEQALEIYRRVGSLNAAYVASNIADYRRQRGEHTAAAELLDFAADEAERGGDLMGVVCARFLQGTAEDAAGNAGARDGAFRASAAALGAADCDLAADDLVMLHRTLEIDSEVPGALKLVDRLASSLLTCHEQGRSTSVAAAVAWDIQAQLAWERGELALAEQLFGKALDMYEQHGFKDEAALLLWGLAEVQEELGKDEQARDAYRRSAAQDAESGDNDSAADSWMNLGEAALGDGDSVGAQTAFETAVEIWRDVGDDRDLAAALWRLGYAHVEQEDCEKARGRFDEALALVEKLDDPDLESQALLHLACTCSEYVDVDLVYMWTERAENLALESRNTKWEALARYCEGEAAYAEEDWGRARAGYERAWELQGDQGDPETEMDFLASLCLVLVEQGDREALGIVLDEARQRMAMDEGGEENFASVLANFARSEWEQGELERARLLLVEATTLFDDIDGNLEGMRTRRLLVLISSELGDEDTAVRLTEEICSLDVGNADPLEEAWNQSFRAFQLWGISGEVKHSETRALAQEGLEESAERIAALAYEAYQREQIVTSMELYSLLGEMALEMGLPAEQAMATMGEMRVWSQLGEIEEVSTAAGRLEDELLAIRRTDLLGEYMIESAHLALSYGVFDGVDDMLQDAREYLDPQKDERVLARAALLQAMLAGQRDEPNEALRWLEEWEELDRGGIATMQGGTACRLRAELARRDGGLDEAHARYESCRDEAGQADLPLSEAFAVLELAGCARQRGDLVDATSLAERAGQQFLDHGHLPGNLTAIVFQAELLVEQGDLTQANSMFDDVLELAASAGVFPGHCLADALEGYVSTALDTNVLSDDVLEQIHEAVLLAGDYSGTRFEPHIAEIRAQVSMQRGDLAAARHELDAAESGWRSLGDEEAIARVLVRKAELEIADGDAGAATRLAKRALKQLRTDGSLTTFLDAHLVHGRALEARGKRDESLAAYERAASLGRSISMDVDVGERGWAGFSEKLALVHDAALRLRGIRALELGVSGGNEDAIAAFQLAEERSARLLGRRSREIGTAMLADSIPDSLRQEEEEYAEIEQLQIVAARGGLTRAQQVRLDELTQKRAGFVDALREKRKYFAYAAVRYSEIPTAETLGLGPEEVLVRFAVLDDEVYRWIFHRGSLARFDAVGMTRDELEANVRSVRRALSTPHSDFIPAGSASRGAEAEFVGGGGEAHAHGAARLLGQALLADALDVLPEGESLILVPDGTLFSLPFEALLLSDEEGGEAYLGLEVPMTYAPSARFFTMVRDRDKFPRKFDGDLLAVGDPDFSDRAKSDARSLLGLSPVAPEVEPLELHAPDHALAARAGLLTPIPHTGVEIDAVVEQLGADRAVVLRGHEATRAATLEALADGTHRVVHVATHGVLPSEPICDDDGAACLDQPALVFAGTPGAAFVDQVLTASDIATLEIPSELVVLSACDTAEGDHIRGEGVMGMGQSFLYAGAGTVLMSLWKVNDEATASWMGEFYEGYAKGGDPAQDALEARRWLAAGGEAGGHPQWAHPYYWAPFIVMGATQ